MKWVAWIAAVTLALDQATKLAIESWLPFGHTEYVIRGLFNLVHVGNTGAAWSILQGNNWLLAVISIVTLAILFWFRRSFPLERPLARWSLGLITGGIIGNLIDRLRVVTSSISSISTGAHGTGTLPQPLLTPYGEFPYASDHLKQGPIPL